LAPVVKSLGLDIRATPKQSRLMRIISPSNEKIDVSQFEVPHQDINHSFTLVFDKKNHFNLYNSTKNLLLSGDVGTLATSRDDTIRLQIDTVPTSLKATFVLTKISDNHVVKQLQHGLLIKDLGENKQNTGVLALTLSHPKAEKSVLILNEIGKTIQSKDIEKNAIEASKTLDFLYQQLPITQQDLDVAESKLNHYRAKSGKIDIKIQAEHLLRQLSEIDKQLAELRVDNIDKLQRYTVEHPLIIALNTKIRELNVERGRLETQLKKLPASDQISVNLMRDVKVKTSLYMVLLKKIQELQVIKAGIVSDVRILSYAQMPHQPLPQKRLLIYMASLILGLMISLVIIFVRKLLYPRVNDPQWSERHFDLINLAIIPYSKEQFINMESLKNPSLNKCVLLAYSHPRNLAIESLRSLRTTLQVRLSCEKNNIVSILGVSPGVGKSFVSANLAYILATAGKRVVVVDTDMRRGTLHKYFSTQPAPGLAELLNSKKTLADVLIPTLHENLMLLPRGTYPNDPSELLTNDHFKNMLNTLSQQFDIVVIDTPPVLLVTDAVLISVHAGTNYLVVGANAHQPIEIEMSIKRLTNAGVTLNGSIFNFHKQASAGQNGYYKYGYYYDDDKEKSKQ
jgi:tyrosine-protein kinase Etk/Wzc